MIDILGKIPRKVSVALSSGIDSTAIHDFLSNNHEVEILYFNHGKTDVSSDFCEESAYLKSKQYNQKIKVGNITRERNKNESLEEYWRNQRYEWLHAQDSEFIVLGHHLDDCVETWVWSSMHGTPKLIPYKRNHNVYRPFLTTPKKELISYAERKGLTYVYDETNKDNNKMRNYVRNVMMKHCLVVNPGISKTIRSKLYGKYENLSYDLKNNEVEDNYM